MADYIDPPKRWVIFKLLHVGVGGRHLYWHEPSCSWVEDAMNATQYSENQRMSMPLPPEGQYELLGGPLGKPEQWIVLRLVNGREMNPPEYWSNEGGWVVGIENATIFSATERDDYQHLPQGGAWSELTEPSDPMDHDPDDNLPRSDMETHTWDSIDTSVGDDEKENAEHARLNAEMASEAELYGEDASTSTCGECGDEYPDSKTSAHPGCDGGVICEDCLLVYNRENPQTIEDHVACIQELVATCRDLQSIIDDMKDTKNGKGNKPERNSQWLDTINKMLDRYDKFLADN